MIWRELISEPYEINSNGKVNASDSGHWRGPVASVEEVDALRDEIKIHNETARMRSERIADLEAELAAVKQSEQAKHDEVLRWKEWHKDSEADRDRLKGALEKECERRVHDGCGGNYVYRDEKCCQDCNLNAALSGDGNDKESK